MTTRRFFRKTGKILLYTFGGILSLVLIAWIFINTDYGKRVVRNKIQAYLEKKLKTKVVIGEIDYSLPKWVEIKNVYIEDQGKDTLLFGEKLSVDLDMIKLIRGNTYIRKVEFKNIYAKVSREETDSVFNFQFIVDAFAGNRSETKVNTDTAAMKLTLKRLLLDNVRLKFTDKNAGSDFTAQIVGLDATLTKFQPDRLQFDIEKFVSNGMNFFMTMYKPSATGPADTSSTAYVPLQITAGMLDLKNVNVTVDDRSTGMYYRNKLHHLSLNNTAFDLAKQKAIADRIVLDSSFIKFIAPKGGTAVSVKDSTIQIVSQGWDIAAATISMTGNQIQFDDFNKVPAEGLDFAHLDIKGLNLNAAGVHYTSDSTMAGITQLAFNDKSGFTLDTTHAVLAYTPTGIIAKELYIKTPQSVVQHTIAITYDDVKQLATAPQNSTVDIQLRNSVIAVNDLYTVMPAVKKFLEPQKFANSIVRLNTTVNGTLQRVNIPLLQLAGFNGTVVNARAVLYNVTDMDKLGYDITIFNSTVPRSDLIKFLPGNNAALSKLPPVLNISTDIKGNLDNATGRIDINSSTFRINAAGRVKNIKNPKALQYDLAIKDSRVDKDFLATVLPPGTIPPSIQLPQTITVMGTAKGDMNNIQPNLKLGGSYGTVIVKGYVRNFKNANAATYDLEFATSDFALGKFIRQDSIVGNVTMSGTAKGRGFDYKTMRSDLKADIQSIGLRQYNYRGAVINAAFDNGNVNSTGNINDPNLQLNYTVTGNIQGAYPSNVEATVQVDTVQLQKLNLYKDSLNGSFKLYVKAPATDPNGLDVFAAVDTSSITVKGKSYLLDSIVARANTLNGTNTVTLRSPFADLNANGNFEYDKIGASIAAYIDRYYNIADTQIVATAPQQISFDGELKKHPLVTDLVGLKYENIPFKGSYASQGGDSALNLTATVPYFAYDGTIVSNGKIDIATINDRINGTVNFDTLRLAKNIFYKTNITANAANDSLGFTLLTKDQKDVDRFGIGANIKINNNNEYTFSLKPDLLLNYKRWNVAADNRIVYSPGGVLVNNFTISSDSASISANSTAAVLNSPVDVTINNFNIREVTAFLGRDTLLAAGILDGRFTISDFNKKLPSFTGNLALEKAEYKQQPVGDIKMFAEKKSDNVVTATIDLTGNGNDVTAKGTYYLNNSNHQFDAELDIRALQLATLQAFSNGALTRSSGSIRGDLALNGKFSEPIWNGDITFDTAQFTLAQLGTPYRIDKQTIALNYPELSLDKFTIKDSANNALVINGTLRERSLMEYDLDLQINAKNFMLVNTPRAANSPVYGFAAINADVIVKGNSTSPDIQGNVSLTDKSDVTIVLPESNINKDAARSVVRFIDRDTFALPEQLTFAPAVEGKPSFGQFINYNLNVEVTKNAALTIIIDPSTGDELRVQGDAQLNAGVNPAGDLVLTGNYELNKGHYILNYQFLRREFVLLPGSTITFSGEPLNAQVNVSAEYIVNTSPKELLDNEIAGMDTRLANTFNQKLPFKVLLYLKGPIKKPQISFDIQLPDDNAQIGSQLRTTVENKLLQLRDDVAATNKQVFSLLLLNRFVGEQSSDFFKGNGSFDQIARESVSKFLSSALDQIAGDIFKGVDVDLSLNSYQDYSTGDQQQRTDLNVAVTKTFLDDRLSITVGKNFGIEGQDAAAKASQRPSNLPDVTINYKLTKDGKYSVRAYKRNQFEVILDGYVVETGVAFIVTMDYDKFRELFQKRK